MSMFRTVWSALAVLCTAATLASVPASAQHMMSQSGASGWLQPLKTFHFVLPSENAERGTPGRSTGPSKLGRTGDLSGSPGRIVRRARRPMGQARRE
jgi:hypothetical protein